MNFPTGHSPLGGSSMATRIKCPGSAIMSEGLEEEESEFAALGTVAHSLGEQCLRDGHDAWEHVGSTLNDLVVDKDMADAVQVYLNAVRKAHPDRNQSNFFVERKFHCPSIHNLMYGQADTVYVEPRVLHIWDYKHGAGIIVEVKDNVQTMYYACGILEELQLWNEIDMVVLHIAQPRGFHWQGPIREWSISTDHLFDWMLGILIPAMVRAETSTDLASGDHCRFCPARSRKCPQLMSDIEMLEAYMAIVPTTEKKGKLVGDAGALSADQVSHLLKLSEVAKIVFTAASKTAFQRMNAGYPIPEYKLAHARSNRVFKDDLKIGEAIVTLEAAAVAAFGDDAMTVPELKSPAQIEELPGGEAFCATWAYKPDNGLTVVRADDNRPAVSKDTKSLFTAATKTRR